MTMSNTKHQAIARRLNVDLYTPAVVMFVVVCCCSFIVSTAVASIPDDALSVEDATCLKCHSFERLSTTLENGEKLSLHVPAQTFAKSVHNWIGCTSCHRDINLNTHTLGANKKTYANKRERSIALAKTCHECHEDKSYQYEGSIHASLVEAGDQAAPVCTDCHGSHTVEPKAAYETLTGAPCKNCHANIFDVYLQSMHGQARSKLGGHIEAPICSDCHRAHDVNVASVEERLKDACLGCHEDAKRAHKDWLPNAGLHLRAVSCAACHAPTARRRVDLMLFDSVAQRPISENEVSPRLGDLPGPSKSGKGLDAKELWNLVRGINREGTAAEVTLRGRMEVATGEQAHQMVWKDKALRDCESCHRDGAEPFQNVTVSLIRADGTRVSYGAEKEVLSSALSMNSVGGFYALGGTRVILLDILLLLAVVAGASVPIVHLAMRKLLKKNQ